MLISGCATNQNIQRLQTDTRFQEAARQLATIYLEGQKAGDSSARYGSGTAKFYNLSEYKIISFGWEWNQPAIFVRVKAGNQAGGNPVWTDYAIRFSHDPQLEAGGDRWLGVGISSVGTTLVKF